MPDFGVRFVALDLNHISDMGTTWQTCHPFDKDSAQYQWYEQLMGGPMPPLVVTLYNERNASVRSQVGGSWGTMLRRGTIAITGFGYFAERAEVDGFTYYNTSLSGKGDKYPDPKSQVPGQREQLRPADLHEEPVEDDRRDQEPGGASARPQGIRGGRKQVKILFLHGWQSTPGGLKPTEHRLADPESLARMLEVVERRFAMKIQAVAGLWLAFAASVWAAEPNAEAKKYGILFNESFEDADLAGRGWYDGTSFRVVGDAAAGKGCVEYEWPDRQSGVKGSSPVRRLFEPTDEVSIRF